MRAALLLLMTGLGGLAGPAAGSDDCMSGPAWDLCLFDDHVEEYGGWDIARYTENTLASADVAVGPARAGADLTQETREFVYGNYAYRGNQTRFQAWHDLGVLDGYVVIFQYDHFEGTPDGSWGWYDWQETGVEAEQDVAGSYWRIQAGQGSVDNTFGTHDCYTYYDYHLGFFDDYGYESCTQGTPGGPVDTRIPQVYDLCLQDVCGRFPDMPDDTGLPFL